MDPPGISSSLKGKLQRLATRSPHGGGGSRSGCGAKFPGSPVATGGPSSPTTGGAVVPGRRGSTKRPRSPSEEGGGGGGDAPPLGVIPTITLDDMGGLQRELPVIKEVIEYPLRFGHLFSRLGADPPCGVLLHGPPGCGKTRLAHAIAGSLKVPLFFVSAPEIVSGVSGDSEHKIRTLFLDAISMAPSIVFLDEIDTITGHRESAQREMERRIVAQLLTCMDQLSHAWREHGKVVCVIGATNRPEGIDSALRRAGRFDREIALGIPSVDERKSILQVVMRRLSIEPNVDFHELSCLTPGFVGADLHLLAKEASIVAIRRIHAELALHNEEDNPDSELLNDFCVLFTELKEAVKRVQPSAMREGFSTIPSVSWADVGALEDVREELNSSILQPIRAPKLHMRFGLDKAIGVLLYGPPGCGKTLVAKAVANESGANFISIKGPELLNKFVGESERSVRIVFARGRASAPCVLFFDELDALAPRRGSDRANPSSERVVNQLLTEMDGVEGREGVYVIGATNRPDMIDPAMLRPGRLDKMLYVPMPSAPQRVSILKTLARRVPLHEEIDLEKIGLSSDLDGYSGADIAALLREASLCALKEVYSSMSAEELDKFERGEISSDALPTLRQSHFAAAHKKIRPSVSAEDRLHYEDQLRCWSRIDPSQ